MIATDPGPQPHDPAAAADLSSPAIPEGLPTTVAYGLRRLPAGEVLELLAVPLTEDADRRAPVGAAAATSIEETVRQWVSAAAGPLVPVAFV
ncbi:MAG: hypothetical protein ACKO1M_06295, partial [Planctomycetota bacterium]